MLIRPLVYSLLIHFLVLISVYVWLSKHSDPLPEKAIKITLNTFSSPATPIAPSHIKTAVPLQQTISKPLKAVPHVQTAPNPLISARAQPSVSVPRTPSPVAPSAPSTTTETHKPAPSVTAAPLPTPSVNVQKEFLDAHLGEIRSLLVQNLKYPRNAQRLKMQGEVRVSFRLKSDGSVENVEVVQSSGFEILDEDACALIKNTAPQFPKPSKSISLSVPLSYILR
ncbi:MAG: energy transducer TonB [Sulfuricurvum sp.]|nr:energy transducer TonB [Sulfuricurvum sp.]